MGMRISRDEIAAKMEKYEPDYSDNFIFKNPVNYGARVSAVKIKIYNATGIMPHKLDILRVSVSTVKAKLAWITFANKKTVNNIFRLAVQNGNTTSLHVFPHIPSKAMARKDAFEKIMKRLQVINKQFRYQIRLGNQDIELYMKNYQEYNWKPYRKIDLSSVDPNGEIPKWDLTFKGEKANRTEVNPFDWSKKPGKRGAIESPEARVSKCNNIDDWQICEFLWAFLEGTTTTPNYKNITWENQPGEVSEEAKENEDDAVEEEEEEDPEETLGESVSA